jgi:hypothetical protein
VERRAPCVAHLGQSRIAEAALVVKKDEMSRSVGKLLAALGPAEMSKGSLTRLVGDTRLMKQNFEMALDRWQSRWCRRGR